VSKQYMVVCCKARSEKACTEDIKDSFGESCDVIAFYEQCVSKPRHRKSSKPVTYDRPVYPGYLFVWLSDAMFWTRLNECRMVGSVLNHDGIPFRIPKERLTPYLPAKANVVSALKKGDAVRILNGPFASFSGTFIRNGLVEINVFGRLTKAHITVNALEHILCR
jgi:transcription antitermination factor NusG